MITNFYFKIFLVPQILTESLANIVNVLIASVSLRVMKTTRIVLSPAFCLSAVFGKSLIDTVMYEQRFGPGTVPILVQKCVEFIVEHGLTEEGIFRLPGQDNAVKQFREAFDAGERPSFPR